MTKGNCAVTGCTNSWYKLNNWKKTACPTHTILQKDCECQPIFILHWIPSKLRNGELSKKVD